MAGELFRIMGAESGQVYVSGCAPEADDLVTAKMIHSLFSSILDGVLCPGWIPEGLSVETYEMSPETDERVWVPYT